MKKNTMFQPIPTQHQQTVQTALDYVDNMVAEGSISHYSAQQVQFAINAYHAQNQTQAPEAFATGLQTVFEYELRSVLTGMHTGLM